MNNGDNFHVGNIVGVHGIKGEVRFKPDADLDGFPFDTVIIAVRGTEASYKVNRARPHKGVFILALEGVGTRDDAQTLVGAELLVPSGRIPPLEEGEYYYSDLIDSQVATDEGTALGTVTGVIATGGNDVLEVNGPLGEVLIPLIESTIVDIDTDSKRITVRLLEGLLPEPE